MQLQPNRIAISLNLNKIQTNLCYADTIHWLNQLIYRLQDAKMRNQCCSSGVGYLYRLFSDGLPCAVALR